MRPTQQLDNVDFSIESITARSSNYLGAGDHLWNVDVLIRIPVKVWNAYRKQKDLGYLYGVAVSNAVYRLNQNIPASHPIVNDNARASKGWKNIKLSYVLSDPNAAEKLGLKVLRCKNGSFSNAYGDRVVILDKAIKPMLKVI
jgi:hypothetical protein